MSMTKAPKQKPIIERLMDMVDAVGDSPLYRAQERVEELKRDLQVAEMELAFRDRQSKAVERAMSYAELDAAFAMGPHDDVLPKLVGKLPATNGIRPWEELARSGADDVQIKTNLAGVRGKNTWDTSVTVGKYEFRADICTLYIKLDRHRVEALKGKELIEAARRVFNIPAAKPAETSAPAKVEKTAKPAKKKLPKKAVAKTKEVEQIAEKQQADPPAPETPAPQELGNDELAMLNSANDAGVIGRLAPAWVRRQLQRKGLIETAREGSGERKRYYCLTEAGREAIGGWKPVLTPLAVNESKQEPARSYPPKPANPKQEDDAEQDRPEDIHVDKERELVLGPFVHCSPGAELNDIIDYVLREAGFADRPLETVVQAFRANGITTLSQIRDLVDTEKTDAREYWRAAFARVCIEYGLEPLWESIERAIKKYLKNLYSA